MNPTLVLRFCDFSPCEEDLALHLNKYEFPSCKNGLCQVGLKLAKCFILKDPFQYTLVKIVSPFVALPDPPETVNCTSVNLNYARKLSCKSELF